MSGKSSVRATVNRVAPSCQPPGPGAGWESVTPSVWRQGAWAGRLHAIMLLSSVWGAWSGIGGIPPGICLFHGCWSSPMTVLRSPSPVSRDSVPRRAAVESTAAPCTILPVLASTPRVACPPVLSRGSWLGRVQAHAVPAPGGKQDNLTQDYNMHSPWPGSGSGTRPCDSMYQSVSFALA